MGHKVDSSRLSLAASYRLRVNAFARPAPHEVVAESVVTDACDVGNTRAEPRRSDRAVGCVTPDTFQPPAVASLDEFDHRLSYASEIKIALARRLKSV
jgi:hypothetical protein